MKTVMKKIKLLLALCIGLGTVNTTAQNAEQKHSVKKWAFVASYGGRAFLTETKDEWPIRQDVGIYHDSNQSISAYSQGYVNYGGISVEYFFNDKAFSVSSGLRYTNVYSAICKYESNENRFFYLRLSSDGTETQFARVNAITESTDYLGIPIEFKATPFRFTNISFYGKLSCEAAFKLNSNTDIQFRDQKMELNEKTFLDKTGLNVTSFYSTATLSIGSTIRFNDHFWVSGDYSLPALYINKDISRLVNITDMSGFQLSLTFPF